MPAPRNAPQRRTFTPNLQLPGDEQAQQIPLRNLDPHRFLFSSQPTSRSHIQRATGFRALADRLLGVNTASRQSRQVAPASSLQVPIARSIQVVSPRVGAKSSTHPIYYTELHTRSQGDPNQVQFQLTSDLYSPHLYRQPRQEGIPVHPPDYGTIVTSDCRTTRQNDPASAYGDVPESVSLEQIGYIGAQTKIKNHVSRTDLVAEGSDKGFGLDSPRTPPFLIATTQRPDPEPQLKHIDDLVPRRPPVFPQMRARMQLENQQNEPVTNPEKGEIRANIKNPSNITDVATQSGRLTRPRPRKVDRPARRTSPQSPEVSRLTDYKTNERKHAKEDVRLCSQTPVNIVLDQSNFNPMKRKTVASADDTASRFRTAGQSISERLGDRAKSTSLMDVAQDMERILRDELLPCDIAPLKRMRTDLWAEIVSKDDDRWAAIEAEYDVREKQIE